MVQVSRFKGSVYQKFDTRTAAEAFVKAGQQVDDGHHDDASSVGSGDTAPVHPNDQAHSSAPVPAAAAAAPAPASSSTSAGLYTLEFDGASRGNPGTAGAGFVLLKGDSVDGVMVGRGARGLGVKTNNEAEVQSAIVPVPWLLFLLPSTSHRPHPQYESVIDGLKAAAIVKPRSLMVAGDSKLVIKYACDVCSKHV